MKNLLVLVVSVLLGGSVFARQETDAEKRMVTGVVTDTAGNGVNNVAIIVMDAADTTSVTWEYSGKDGRFRVQYPHLQGKRLLLYLQSNGYQSRYIALRDDLPSQDLGRVVLQPLHLNLAAATVTALPAIRQQFVRGVDEFHIPQAVGDSKYDIYALLAEIPGLNVEGENVEVIGRNGGVKFTINGLDPRPGELRDLPPSDVEKVCVDRMPSARFDKSVTGVINIVTRKKLRDYLSMRVSSGFSMTCEPVTTTSAVVNGKFGRLSTYLNGTYTYGRYYQEGMEVYTMHLDGTDFKRKTQSSDLFISHLPQLAFSPKYQINDKSFIDLQYNYNKDNTKEETPTVFEMVGIEKSVTDRQNSNRGENHNLQLRYVYGENSANRVVLNAGYAGNRNKRHDVVDELITAGDSIVENLYTDYWSRTTNDVLTFSVDHERNFTKNLYCSVGGSFAEIWNTARQDYVQGTSILTTTEETQASLYATFGHQINKFYYRIGLRGEYLYKHHAGDSEANERPFLLLPSISLSYAFSEKFSLSGDYRRSTIHPSLGQRNPILDYNNKYEYFQGNPNLKSSVNNALYLGINLPRNLSIYLNYHFFKNTILNVYQIYDAEKKQTLTQPVNIHSHNSFSANISWRGKWKWYSLNLNGKVFKGWGQPSEILGNFKPKQPYCSLQVRNTAKIAKNIYGVVQFNYQTAGEELNFRSDKQYSLSAVLDMSFFEKRVRVYVAYNNIVYADAHKWLYYNDITSETKSRLFKRTFNISVSYNFKRFTNWFRRNDSNAGVLERIQ